MLSSQSSWCPSLEIIQDAWCIWTILGLFQRFFEGLLSEPFVTWINLIILFYMYLPVQFHGTCDQPWLTAYYYVWSLYLKRFTKVSRSGLQEGTTGSMAQKRKNGNEPDDMTSREKKKLKLSVARTIATQAGPSSRTIPTNSVFINYIFTTLKEASSGIRYGRFAQCHRYREICRSGWCLMK